MPAKQILALLLHIHYVLEVAGVTNTLLPTPPSPWDVCRLLVLAALLSLPPFSLSTLIFAVLAEPWETCSQKWARLKEGNAICKASFPAPRWGKERPKCQNISQPRFQSEKDKTAT